ncbi:MAG TPA: superoxide dismutase family protein [Burkholderiales bacterium]|nr:superoxide dismutase family protein [Burkholderiales bacterium]
MRVALVIGFAATALAGCEAMQSMWGGGVKATANLQPTKGSTVRGTANFEQRGDKVRVAADVSGLRPNGEFGFHVHELGDCSSGDGMSAKGHFNPFGKPHGSPGGAERHAGDLPSLKSDANGDANYTADLDVVTVTSGSAGIVGRSLIVHVQPDDYKTQPTGNAGTRSACAVIQRLS